MMSVVLLLCANSYVHSLGRVAFLIHWRQSSTMPGNGKHNQIRNLIWYATDAFSLAGPTILIDIFFSLNI
jgi:hypothetical protein